MNLQEQYQKETGKKCAIPDHNGSKTIPTWEYVEWLEARIAKQKPEATDNRWQSILKMPLNTEHCWLKLENGNVYDFEDNWEKERQTVTHFIAK